MARILIIDDDKAVCKFISSFVKSMGHEPKSAYTLNSGLEQIYTNPFELVFLDVNLPDGDGIKAISKFKNMPGSPEIVVITGEGSINGVELAIQNGAWDYIQKPCGLDEIRLLLIRVLQYRDKKAKRNIPVALKREGIVGTSPEIAHCLELVAKAAATEANVLITGETGTGKELFAKAIHENSQRRENPFVVVDCAALPENLVESALFGYVKGAFTGADHPREGLIKEADRGTLFLDEVGELPLSQQKSFLRVLQEQRFRQVGGKEDIHSDFRLISATNRDPDKLIETGTFRKDLFFRLRSITIQLPPLRTRRSDIPEIFVYYINKLIRKYNAGQKGFSPEFIDSLNRYDWPGNVRELVHAIESALSESLDDPILFPIHLPKHIRSRIKRDSVGAVGLESDDDRGGSTRASFPTIRDLIATTEKKYFENLIVKTKGDMEEICRIAGLSRSKVYARFKKYGLSKFKS